MVTKKSLFSGLFFCFAFSSQLVSSSVLLSFLQEEDDGDSVGIIGIDTEHWWFDNAKKGFAHFSLRGEHLECYHGYTPLLKKFVEQQMSGEMAQDYGKTRIDFLLEARRQPEATPLFPYEICRCFRSCKKQNHLNHLNTNFSCCNLWDKKVEQLLRFVCGSEAEEMQKIAYGNSSNIGTYQKLFNQTLKDYVAALRVVKANDKEQIFNDHLCGLVAIVDTLNHWIKKFQRQSVTCIFDILKRVLKVSCRHARKNTICDRCRLEDWIDDIGHYYWSAKYFTQIIFPQKESEGDRKTVLICNRYSAEAVEDMLLHCNYKKIYRTDSRNTKSTIVPYQLKAFITFLTDRCNVCGKSKKFTCSACKKAFYCDVACQYKDWEEHRKFCRKRPKKVVEEAIEQILRAMDKEDGP